MKGEGSKYRADNLVPMFRKAAALRNEMIAAGFTDNGGAIHSAERILDILGQRLKYPGLSHINNFKHYAGAEFSNAAWETHRRSKSTKIEHVSPVRIFTRNAIALLDDGASGAALLDYVREYFQLVYTHTRGDCASQQDQSVKNEI